MWADRNKIAKMSANSFEFIPYVMRITVAI